jgi:hypothetical protein
MKVLYYVLTFIRYAGASYLRIDRYNLSYLLVDKAKPYLDNELNIVLI